MTNKPVADQPPGTPTRVAKKASGGGSKKLQQLLGASESDIDLLLRPAEIVSTQTHRVSVLKCTQFTISLTVLNSPSAFRCINWC